MKVLQRGMPIDLRHELFIGHFSEGSMGMRIFLEDTHCNPFEETAWRVFLILDHHLTKDRHDACCSSRIGQKDVSMEFISEIQVPLYLRDKGHVPFFRCPWGPGIPETVV